MLFAEESCRVRSGCLMAMDMGTGKTRSSLEIAARNFPSGKILVVCPKSVLAVWQQEASEYFHPSNLIFWRKTKETGRQTGEAIAEADRLHDQHPNKMLICAVNYETIGSRTGSDFLAAAGHIKWDILIADEAHRLKSHQSKISLAFSSANPKIRSEWKLGLTGTPMTKTFLDIFGVARFCAPDVYGDSYWKFADRYTFPLQTGDYRKNSIILKRDRHGNYVRGVPARMEEFQEKLKSFSYRVAAEDVLDLPPVRDVKIFADLPKKTADAYRQAAEEMRIDMEDSVLSIPNKDVQVMRLQQIVAGHLPVLNAKTGETELLDIGGKREAYKTVMEDIPEDEPVVVFGRFLADLDVAASCAAGGYSELSGRRNQLSEWQNGKTRVLGVQIEAGGVGVDLTRARYAVWYTLSWNSGSYLQARARLVRPGQKHSVCFVHLIGANTIDEAIYARVHSNTEKIETAAQWNKQTTANTI